MKLYLRASVLIPAAILVSIMLRLSWWQHERYQEKLVLIEQLKHRLAEPVVPLTSLLNQPPEALSFRRVSVSGTYDFANEVILRNRRHEGLVGVFTLTPLQLSGGEAGNGPIYVLVSRGFIPLSHSQREQRVAFQQTPEATFTAIIKQSSSRRFLAPRDPPSGPSSPWVDAWLRVDLPNIQAQLPYRIAPFYLEVIPENQVDSLSITIVQSHSEREEMLSMASRKPVSRAPSLSDYNFPIPSPSTVVPAGRHRQYVFEWLILAGLTAIGACIIMLRPRRS